MKNDSGTLTERFFSTGKLGCMSALLVAVLTTGTFVMALCTPPISGPFATDPISYPFTDILARYPRDYLWMFPAMLLMLLFVVLSVCVLHEAQGNQKLPAHIGVIFAAISCSILFSDYFIQVSVVQQSLLNAETDGIALLSQYNPHGLFVVLEEIGYLFMTLSFACFAPVFSGKNKLETAIRRLLLTACTLGVLALLLVTVAFGIRREYFFEVIIISIDFLFLIVLGILLSIWFREKTS
jgi:hypothetical protein